MTWPDDDNAQSLPDQLVAAYRSASRQGTHTIPALAHQLGIDEGTAHELVADWTHAGLATVDASGFRLQAPNAAVARYLGSVSARLRRDLAGLNQLLSASGMLETIWRESLEHDATDYTIDRMDDDGSGWFAWWAHLIERDGVQASAIVSNLDALQLMDAIAPGHLERLLVLLRRGETTLRLVVPPEAHSGAAAELMTRLVEAGAGIRVAGAGGWFAVAAGAMALVPAEWGRDRDVAAVIVREPSIVAGFEQLFLLRWHSAAGWDATDGPAADPVIGELCRGRTDGEVALAFGLSVRSVRRRVAAALRETGATSRMELAHRLGMARARETLSTP